MNPAEIARTTARILLEIKAIHFNVAKPFIFTSGWASPTYIDCRKIISFPRARAQLMQMAVETIDREIGFEIGGCGGRRRDGGHPFSAWIADRMNVPMLYVRKKPRASAATR